MVFGAISRFGQSELHFNLEKDKKEATINSANYQAILKDILLPMAKKQFKYGIRAYQQFYFQQDNATAHVSVSTK